MASRNAADLRNLVEVTLDAVLRPLLRDPHFDEEAWHVGPDPRGERRLGGIVLTEMQGHLASPANRLDLETRRAILPGTVYARAHGGDPAAIPSLGPGAARRFHRRHYHPSNARVFLWGRDLDARLDQLGRHFEGFGPRPAAPPRRSPHPSRSRAGCGASGSAGQGSIVDLAWALPDAAETLGPLTWPLLAALLAEGPGASLHRALDEAGLGGALPGAALLDTQPAVLRLRRQAVDPARISEVERVALAALSRAVEGEWGRRLGRGPPRARDAARGGRVRRSAPGPRGLRPHPRAVAARTRPAGALDHRAALRSLEDGLRAAA